MKRNRRWWLVAVGIFYSSRPNEWMRQSGLRLYDDRPVQRVVCSRVRAQPNPLPRANEYSFRSTLDLEQKCKVIKFVLFISDGWMRYALNCHRSSVDSTKSVGGCVNICINPKSQVNYRLMDCLSLGWVPLLLYPSAVFLIPFQFIYTRETGPSQASWSDLSNIIKFTSTTHNVLIRIKWVFLVVESSIASPVHASEYIYGRISCRTYGNEYLLHILCLYRLHIVSSPRSRGWVLTNCSMD